MTNPTIDPRTPPFGEAFRFWEPRRLVYNAILTAVVLLWVILTWPHFRPALTLGSLEAFFVLGLAANLCYCTAYVVEFFVRAVRPSTSWLRFRKALFVLGMLFALVLENYWIVDEIYPYADHPPASIVGGTNSMPASHIASNMNFPAPLAVVGFLAAVGGLFLASSSALIFWFARKPKYARIAAFSIATGAVIYCALLITFSAASHETVLAHGQEKYFCEVDCHLAYSVVDVKTQPDGRYRVTLRTRFDETTTTPARPKDAPLTPSPREVRLIDSAGHEYVPVFTSGTPLHTPLRPAGSYTTQLEFNLPTDAAGLRLLINTTPGWPDKVVIGDENSLLHKKTYFAL